MCILSSANFKKDPPWNIFCLSLHAPATCVAPRLRDNGTSLSPYNHRWDQNSLRPLVLSRLMCLWHCVRSMFLLVFCQSFLPCYLAILASSCGTPPINMPSFTSYQKTLSNWSFIKKKILTSVTMTTMTSRRETPIESGTITELPWLRNCGFSSNWILHYFPLFVRVFVCHRRDISHFSHI